MKLKFDIAGFHITQACGTKHHMWLWVGPSTSADGLLVWNIVAGPIHFAFYL